MSVVGPGSLLELLELERLDRDLYRANVVFDDPFRLYGGQVAAQALRAGGLTVGKGWAPHSLHVYFLRSGDAASPTIFRVERDRDGRSFAARRVVAVQDGEVLCNMSCSFAAPEQGPEHEVTAPPSAEPPQECKPYALPRLFSMESRLPTQPYPSVRWPVRFWARATEDLGADELLHACALTYLSDISTGLAPFVDETIGMSSSLDHAMWFHRPLRLDEWVLVDLIPHTTAHGRGLYSGTVHDANGRLGASITQESLFRIRRR